MSNKLKSRLCFIASLITSVVIPIVVVCTKFHIIKVFKAQPYSIKISVIAAIIILTLLIVFFKRIMNYLNTFDFSYAVYFIKGLLKIIPLVCVLIIFVNIIKVINDLVFVTGWIVGCNAVTFFVLDPLTAKYTFEYKKDIQRNVVKEAVDGKY